MHIKNLNQKIVWSLRIAAVCFVSTGVLSCMLEGWKSGVIYIMAGAMWLVMSEVWRDKNIKKDSELGNDSSVDADKSEHDESRA